MINTNLKTLSFLFILFTTSLAIKAQDEYLDIFYYDAIDEFEAENYQKAIELFEEEIEIYPACKECYLYLGLAYMNSNTKTEQAKTVLEKGISLLSKDDEQNDLYKDMYMAYAKTLQVLLQTDKAKEVYQLLKQKFPNDRFTFIEEIEEEIRVCDNSSIFLENPIKLSITNLGEKINSSCDDHNPLINIVDDKLYFTSRRPNKKTTKLKDGQNPEKIYTASKEDGKWKQSHALNIFFKVQDHESILSLSADGKELFILHNDEDIKNIYHSVLVNNVWQKPVKLPKPINSQANETHASLSPDKSTLFFTSDREGGYGGKDIYMIKKDEHGNWGEARNLGPQVNTPFDEETAMLHPDGNTLYFASEGHNGMGQLDVFYTQMNPDSTWTSPSNMGYPINTPEDDFFFLPTIDKNKAYYASTHFSGNMGGSDLYKIEFDKTLERELAVIEGVVEDKQSLTNGSVRIMVTRKKDNVLVGDYRPDQKDGKYTLFLKTGEQYYITETSVNKDEKRSYLDINKDLAFNNNKKIVPFGKIRLEPPMIPLTVKDEIKNHTDNIIKGLNDMTQKARVDSAYYTIQVLALKRKPTWAYLYLKGLNQKELQIFKGADGFTRYVYGAFKGKEFTAKKRNELVETGKYKDSFIRPLKDFTEDIFNHSKQ